MSVPDNIVWLMVICVYSNYEVCGQNYSRRVLMVLTQNTSLGIEDVWNTTSGINYGNGSKETLSLDNIISEGTYRSTLVNSWTTNSPSQVTVEVTNTVGVVLWWTVFNTTGTHATLSSWMTHSNILNTSTDLLSSTEDPKFYFSNGTYDLLLSHNTSSDMAWLCVYRTMTSSPASSVFLITSSQKSELLTLSGLLPPQGETLYYDNHDTTGNIEMIVYDSDTMMNVKEILACAKDSRYSLHLRLYNFNIKYSIFRCSSNSLLHIQVDGTEIFKTKSEGACILSGSYMMTIPSILVRCLVITLLTSDSGFYFLFKTKGSTSKFVTGDAIAVTGYWLESNVEQSLITTETGLTTSGTGLTTTGTGLMTTGTGLATSVTELTTNETGLATIVTTFATPDGSTSSANVVSTNPSSSEYFTNLLENTTINSEMGTTTATPMSTGTSETDMVSIPHDTTSTGVEYANGTAHTIDVSTDGTTKSSPIGIHSTQQSRFEETFFVGPCVCTCTGSGFNVTSEELALRIQHLKRESRLDRKTLNVYYRGLTSATDKRISSQYLGCTGGIVLAVFLCVIFVSDCQRCRYCLLKFRRNQQLKAKKKKGFVN